MPMHDWTRVDAGTYHDFHQGWATALRTALNTGVLPDGYEAMVEQHADRGIPDLLALEVGAPGPDGANGHATPAEAPPPGLTSVAVAPPPVRFTAAASSDPYTRLRKTVVIRRGEDRVVARLELVSPGNKAARNPFREFVGKVTAAIGHGLHVLVLDPFPPGPRDPNGVHAAVWAGFGDEPYSPPADKPLTFAAYDAGPATRAYVEPVAVGDRLPRMPLFLAPGWYVRVPLEESYTAALAGVPRRTRERLGVAGPPPGG